MIERRVQESPTSGSGKSTFVRNMALPVHGWYRFPAGFSAEWVESIISSQRHRLDGLSFLDPFAGVGTAILAAERVGVPACGIEAQPFVARIAQAKLLWWADTQQFFERGQALLARARRGNGTAPCYPSLIQRCYSPVAIGQLHNLLSAWEDLRDESAESQLTWLALVAILRVCSTAGTAPWQYVLPRKSKSSATPPYDAFCLQMQRMLADMSLCQASGLGRSGQVLAGDARSCSAIGDSTVGLVVTSPPYANNYDYADATRLEMTFFGEVRGWGDLQIKARSHLIRSCSQHVSAEQASLDTLLKGLQGVPFYTQIEEVCAKLSEQRLCHGGKKDYHLMIAAYFLDMRAVWSSLRRICAGGSEVWFVIGDSAPYGVHVPVDRWLGELALAAGFKRYGFEKLRDRNVKWENRKHRVPLLEGVLRIQA